MKVKDTCDAEDQAAREESQQSVEVVLEKSKGKPKAKAKPKKWGK